MLRTVSVARVRALMETRVLRCDWLRRTLTSLPEPSRWTSSASSALPSISGTNWSMWAMGLVPMMNSISSRSTSFTTMIFILFKKCRARSLSASLGSKLWTSGSTLVAVAGSMTRITASTLMGASRLEYCDTTLEHREVVALFSSVSRSLSCTGLLMSVRTSTPRSTAFWKDSEMVVVEVRGVVVEVRGVEMEVVEVRGVVVEVEVRIVVVERICAGLSRSTYAPPLLLLLPPLGALRDIAASGITTDDG
ncbi:hypothetical protein CRUP_000197 [Coryphaenoides rupestris]|nr:hypothetical protein CRUP_000197 [Coryphaenoides rupestris]